MRCYYHPTTDAVGSCKSCGKGLCPLCAADLGKGLACRERCENDVRALNAFVERNMRLQPASARFGSLLFVFMGAAFLLYGLTVGQRMYVVTLSGAGLMVYGLLVLYSARTAAQSRQAEPGAE